MKRITKTLSMEKGVVDAIVSLAKVERRSFTKQVEVMLEEALKRQREQA